LRYCRTPNDAPVAPFLRSNRRIDSNYFRFKVNICRRYGEAFMLLIILIMLLLFGGGGGYYAYGPRGGIGIGGIILIILIVMLLTGRL
jgi:hypothetical protein